MYESKDTTEPNWFWTIIFALIIMGFIWLISPGPKRPYVERNEKAISELNR